MTQYARPDEDLSTGGDLWATQDSMNEDLWATIDEDPTASADDDDYIIATDMDGAVVTCKISLSNVSDPDNAVNHKVKFRAYQNEGDDGDADLKVALYLSNGSTKIAESEVTPSHPDNFVNYEFTLSSTEANNITSYNDLQLWFTMTPDGGCEGEMSCVYGGDLQVSQAWFECDDAGVAPSTGSPAFLLFAGL